MEKVYDTACSQTVSDSGTDVSPTLLNFADRAGCGAFNVFIFYSHEVKDNNDVWVKFVKSTSSLVTGKNSIPTRSTIQVANLAIG
ncbi:hypothetical protein T03_5891 [Trichinella britovi]|uniref:Uncharacterized protein n=1 Tax=Trichinella britovi TaxID=45882 RepID=A0A0V1DE64_TRIBR|nr:hypothetical protein T03_5891 [Trichinella britovi]